MSKKTFSDSRWFGGIDEIKGNDTGYKGKPVKTKEEVRAMIKEANEYRIKHGMPLYGKPKNKEKE